MLPTQFLEEMGKKLSESLANSPAKDLEKNARAMVGAALSKLDVVTREEFEIQQAVLLRTRERLAELEARLSALEAATGHPHTPSTGSEETASTD